MKTGEYDAILTSPPCGTFSRARWANRAGPRPLRLRHCPRGFPWLAKDAGQGVELANTFVDFSTDMLAAQFEQSADSMGVMEHPEDLGVVRYTTPPQHPGSAWHFTGTQKLLDYPGVIWGALAQSDFGTPYLKPTRLLGRVPGLEEVVYAGAPAFDDEGLYIGPLPRGCQGMSMKVGRDKTGAFRTAVTAAWPPLLCAALAERMVAAFAQRGSKALKVGRSLGERADPDLLRPPLPPPHAVPLPPSHADPPLNVPLPLRRGPEEAVIVIDDPPSSSPSDPPPVINEKVSDKLYEGLPPTGKTTRATLTKAIADTIRNEGSSNYVYVGRGWPRAIKMRRPTP